MNKNIEGQLLRIERIRQGKELKEVAGNICGVSTLSKIERGKQQIDPEMLVKLYKELGITYVNDEEFVSSMSTYLKQYFYELNYNFEPVAKTVLESENEKLLNSPLAVDWMIVRVAEYQDEESYNILEKCTEFMSEESLAWFYLLHRNEDKGTRLKKKTYAQRVLQNSFATLKLMSTHWQYGDYNEVNVLSKVAINIALEEGNTWALSQIYSLLGGIFSAYNMEEAMISEYKKVINLLKNTNWQDELNIIYYNMGATYISLGKYDLARECLEKVKLDYTNLYHKLAVLEIKTGNIDKANEWINKLEAEIAEEENKYAKDTHYSGYIEEQKNISEITKMQANSDYMDTDRYIEILEKLMKGFQKDGRVGYMNFHKEYLKEAYIKKRRYKDALELEGLLSEIKSKHILKV